ncbi:MAG TPA: LicD family protein [Rheinheimera sp.]|uniref:nucleoside-diphosphate sugar epimerase/dehydratase n=1 Tax=Rheinheimera sp. TaxID=1869214 RepID=UPI002F947D8B
MNTSAPVLLFGASKAGEFFLQQNPNLNVIAVLDNDPARQGCQLSGIPVIAPSELQAVQFEQIIITSQWVDAISAQLAAMGVPADKITVPTKQQLKAAKPFMHAATLQLAHQLLQRLNAYLQQHGIRPCLDSGTLLGVIRQQSLIPWDDDIDLAIDDAEFDALLQLMPDFITLLPEPEQLSWQIVVLTIDQVDACINLEFTPKAGSELLPFDLSLQRRQIKGENSELVSSAGLFFAPAHHFARYEQVQFLGQSFYIPSDTPGFLEFMYGNWQQPVQGTRITEYQNRRSQLPAAKMQVRVQKRLLGRTN